jgi:hypothetical protein
MRRACSQRPAKQCAKCHSCTKKSLQISLLRDPVRMALFCNRLTFVRFWGRGPVQPDIRVGRARCRRKCHQHPADGWEGQEDFGGDQPRQRYVITGSRSGLARNEKGGSGRIGYPNPWIRFVWRSALTASLTDFHFKDGSRWGGGWFCPRGGVAMREEVPGEVRCPQCRRNKGGLHLQVSTAASAFRRVAVSINCSPNPGNPHG